jgi:hypothetical protein
MRSKLFLSLIGATAAATASAQPAPPPAPTTSSDAIVVTGERNAKKAVSDFVHALTPTLWQGQISRFEHSVCPGVVGIAPHQAEAVTERMRLVAKAAGIVVDGPKCSPNVVLIVTSDKKTFMEELRHHHGEYFGDMTNERIHALEQEPGPAAAWQLRGPPINAAGQDLYQDPATGFYMNKTIEGSSRLTESARPQFDAAVVVVERNALTGLTVTQLADYAAIRALTGADPAKLANSTAPTILHVLEVPEGGETPITMTSWDLAFLKGFYDVRRNMHPSAQRSAITDGMAKDLQKPPKH